MLNDKVIAVVGFTIVGGRIAALDFVLDREKLRGSRSSNQTEARGAQRPRGERRRDLIPRSGGADPSVEGRPSDMGMLRCAQELAPGSSAAG